ncbi:outer membrane protein [Devosia aurantiaca]|uniref:Porin family protein n=1 Tax=Devosia aurantiaca TaxID=2714858 RepID=A0A6M1STR7_9HYPH|nr:outer membrane beta-barrel protein [Devosia aurantiaca]NGP18565.1 porin family protein [Devosia aurantiaca]
MTGATSKLVVALLLTGTAVGTPSAQEAVDATGSWNGFHVGVQTGVTGSKIGYVQQGIPEFDIEDEEYSFADRNGIFSVYAGYDHDFGNRFVGGVEVDASWLNIDISPFNSGGFGSLFSNTYALGISSRLGYVVSPETLVYARGGVVGLYVEGEEGFDGTATDFLPAARFGLGVETFLVGNVTGRVEANYTLPLRELEIPDDGETFDPRNLAITAGLSWRFGDEAVPSTAHLPEPSKDDWQGAYIGANVAYTLGDLDFDLTTPGATVGPFAAEFVNAGVVAGYDFRIDDLVFGVEADWQLLGGQFFDPAQNSPLEGSTELIGSVDNSFFISGRVGFLANPDTLIYGKGGIGVIETTANPEFFTFDSGGTQTLPAVQLGGGFETRLADHVNLRLEGLYTHTTEGFVVDLTQEEQATLFPSTVSAKAGLVFHF